MRYVWPAMTRYGRCSACGLLVALHFTDDNRKLTCEEAKVTHSVEFAKASVGLPSILARQLQSVLNRKSQELKHAGCGTPMTRTREGRYECPTCCVTVIVGRLGHRDHAFEGDKRQAGHLPTLSRYDGDFQ